MKRLVKQRLELRKLAGKLDLKGMTGELASLCEVAADTFLTATESQLALPGSADRLVPNAEVPDFISVTLTCIATKVDVRPNN